MKLARTKEWRESHGLTQRELAAEAGVGEVTVARIEADASVSPPTARKVADALGVSVADLLERPPVPVAESPDPGPAGGAVPKGPDQAEWGAPEDRPKVPKPESAGERIRVGLRDDLSDEPARVTLTRTAFLEVIRELREGKISSEEDAWEQAVGRSA